jgi:hypothetical protein
LRLVPYHFLQSFLGRLKIVPLPVEDSRSFFTRFVHVVLEIHVVEAFFHRVAFVRVEDKHFAEEVQGGRVSVRIDFVPFLLASLGLLAQEFTFTFSDNELLVLSGGCAENSNSSLNLV